MNEFLEYLENHPVEFKEEDFFEEYLPIKGKRKSNRDQSYYRYQRDRAINRKCSIFRTWFSDKNHFNEHFGTNPKWLGSLNKGKIHCSCWMCMTKTWRYGLPISEKKYWDAMEKQLKEYK